MANADDDWKPSGRPQSTIARNFSASLNDAFAMDNNLEGLAQSVEQKKQALTSQTAELQALEARLRETETRLQEQRASSPARTHGGSPHRRQPITNTFDGQENDRLQKNVSSPLASQVPQNADVREGNGVSASTRSQWMPQQASGGVGGSGRLEMERAGGQGERRF